MPKLDRRFEDNDAFDERGILKDGATARISLSMRDALPDRPLTVDEMAIKVIEHDAKRRRHLHVEAPGNLPFSLGRPGHRHLVAADGNRQQQADIAAARQRVLDARAAYLDDLTNAWRSPPTGAGAQEHEFATPQSGSPCTKDGNPGRWGMDDDGNMVCIVDSRATGDSSTKTLQQLLKDRAAIMTPLYEQIERELSEAWRTK